MVSHQDRQTDCSSTDCIKDSYGSQLCVSWEVNAPPHHMRVVLVRTDSVSNATKWLTYSQLAQRGLLRHTTILLYFVQIFKTFCRFFANQQFRSKVILSLIPLNCYGYSRPNTPRSALNVLSCEV